MLCYLLSGIVELRSDAVAVVSFMTDCENGQSSNSFVDVVRANGLRRKRPPIRDPSCRNSSEKIETEYRWPSSSWKSRCVDIHIVQRTLEAKDRTVLVIA